MTNGTSTPPSPAPRTPPGLEQIWTEFSASLGHFIRARVSDPATAEDLRQEVFAKVQRQLHRLENPARLPGWILQIARNTIIDHYRRQKPAEELADTLVDDRAPAPAEAAGHAERDAWLAAFRRMVNELPPAYREAVVLADLEELPQKDVAERLGISLSGAKSRVQRGRQQLRTMLLDCCRFEFDRRGGIVGCEPRPGGGCPECPAPPAPPGSDPVGGAHGSGRARPN